MFLYIKCKAAVKKIVLPFNETRNLVRMIFRHERLEINIFNTLGSSLKQSGDLNIPITLLHEPYTKCYVNYKILECNKYMLSITNLPDVNTVTVNSSQKGLTLSKAG